MRKSYKGVAQFKYIFFMNHKASYIIDNINELGIQDRKEVLQMVYNSPARGKLKEKGSGTQVKITDLPESMIVQIYDFVGAKLQEQYLVL
jgi:hypothetical protein